MDSEWANLALKVIKSHNKNLRKIDTGVYFYDENGTEVTRYHSKDAIKYIKPSEKEEVKCE